MVLYLLDKYKLSYFCIDLPSFPLDVGNYAFGYRSKISAKNLFAHKIYV